MVNDHSDSERGNSLPPHRLLFPINSKCSFICNITQTGKYIPQPVVELCIIRLPLVAVILDG